MVFMPIASAQPSSRSMVAGSKVSACHISNSLTAVEGRKSAPTGQGCCVYQALACASVQRSRVPDGCCALRQETTVNNNRTAGQRLDLQNNRCIGTPSFNWKEHST